MDFAIFAQDVASLVCCCFCFRYIDPCIEVVNLLATPVSYRFQTGTSHNNGNVSAGGGMAKNGLMSSSGVNHCHGKLEAGEFSRLVLAHPNDIDSMSVRASLVGCLTATGTLSTAQPAYMPMSFTYLNAFSSQIGVDGNSHCAPFVVPTKDTVRMCFVPYNNEPDSSHKHGKDRIAIRIERHTSSNGAPRFTFYSKYWVRTLVVICFGVES